jgi:hypothetical protein
VQELSAANADSLSARTKAEILQAELTSVRAALSEVRESRAAQLGTLEGRLLGTEAALAKAREEALRFRSSTTETVTSTRAFEVSQPGALCLCAE